MEKQNVAEPKPMDPAVRELAELVGRVLAERWMRKQRMMPPGPLEKIERGKAKRS